MTVTPARTPAPTRPPARARGARGRGWSRAVAIVATALMLAGSGAIGVSDAASAADAGPRVTAATPSPTPPPTGRVDLTLSPAGNGVVRAGDALTVAVTIANGTSTPTAPTRVSLGLGASVLPDRAALTAWLGSASGSTPTTTVVGTVDIPAVAAGSSESRSITVASTDPALAARATGVYPLIASAPVTSGIVTSASAMIVPNDAATTTQVGVVVPITGPPTGDGLLTTVQLTDLTAPGGALTSALDAVDGTPAILAVDPAIPAAIRVLGAAAPARAVAWLTRLEGLPNSRFALQFGDADVAAQIESGLAAPQRPTSLQAYMSPADFATAPAGAPSPSPSATAGPTYPPLDQLLDIGGGRPDVFWPATGTATAGVLGGLAAGSPSSMTLVPSATLASGAASATTSARGMVGGAGVLVYDSDISSALHAASLIDTATLRGAPLTAATAYLAFATADSAGRPLMVTVDRGSDRSALALSAAIASAAGPGTTSVGLEALTTATPQATTAVDIAPETARVDAASALFAGEARIATFSTILDDPSLLTGPQRAESLQLLGNAWRDSPDAWQAALASNRAATGVTLDAVGILAPTTIQLLSPQAPLQFWVRNDLPYPVNVVLYASPDDLRLDVQRKTTVTGATPHGNTRVEVPVTAHVSNTQVSVDLQLHSVTGEVIGAPQRADITVRAEWEGIGVTSLLVIIAGLVVFGLVRTVLRRRRRRRDGAVTDAAGDVGTGDAGPPPPLDPPDAPGAA